MFSAICTSIWGCLRLLASRAEESIVVSNEYFDTSMVKRSKLSRSRRSSYRPLAPLLPKDKGQSAVLPDDPGSSLVEASPLQSTTNAALPRTFERLAGPEQTAFEQTLKNDSLAPQYRSLSTTCNAVGQGSPGSLPIGVFANPQASPRCGEVASARRMHRKTTTPTGRKNCPHRAFAASLPQDLVDLAIHHPEYLQAMYRRWQPRTSSLYPSPDSGLRMFVPLGFPKPQHSWDTGIQYGGALAPRPLPFTDCLHQSICSPNSEIYLQTDDHHSPTDVPNGWQRFDMSTTQTRLNQALTQASNAALNLNSGSSHASGVVTCKISPYLEGPRMGPFRVPSGHTVSLDGSSATADLRQTPIVPKVECEIVNPALLDSENTGASKSRKRKAKRAESNSGGKRTRRTPLSG